jgi:DNA end-binding protein Ku
MFYENEIVDAGEIPGVAHGKAAHVDKRQTDVARQLIESMTIEWDSARYKDEYSSKVKKVIEQKIEGGEVIEAPVVPAAEGAQVVDLLDALQRSVEATKARGKKHPETLADLADLRPVARVGRVPARRAKAIKTATRHRPAGGRRQSRSRRG